MAETKTPTDGCAAIQAVKLSSIHNDSRDILAHTIGILATMANAKTVSDGLSKSPLFGFRTTDDKEAAVKRQYPALPEFASPLTGVALLNEF
jgi:uridylate kinase